MHCLTPVHNGLLNCAGQAGWYIRQDDPPTWGGNES